MDPRRDRGPAHLGGRASDETPALSIVIPVYNEGENVVGTLRGVVEQTQTRPLEVLVVHDFDEDTTVPVVKRLQAELPQLRPQRDEIRASRGTSALRSDHDGRRLRRPGRYRPHV